MPKAILQKRAEVIAEFNLSRKKQINIGSSKENDIVIDDKSISEHHCSLTINDGKYELKDNNTLSGTRVDGRSITIHELQLGSKISVGSHAIVLRSTEKRIRTGKGAAETDTEIVEETPHFLLGIYGKHEGRKYEIKSGDTYIGREETTPKGIANDIVLSGDATVSKGHAKVTRTGNKFVLMDTGSTGGVAVNGDKLGQLNSVDLNAGDEIAIGRSIFRFIAGDNNDFSLPKKYATFFIRIQKTLSLILTLLVLGGSAFYLVKGIRGIGIITDVPKKMTVEFDQGWSAKGNMPHAAPGEYDISSSPALADINNDGINDVVFVNASGQLNAWSGKTGARLWEAVDIQNPGKASPSAADMNNDGVIDIAVVSGTSMLYIIDGQTGVIIYKDMLGGTIGDSSPAVGDLNLDGKRDVVVCSEEGNVYFIYAPGFELESEKFVEAVEWPLYASPVIIASKDLSPLVAVCSYKSKVYLFDGGTREKKTIDLVEKTGKAHLIQAAPGVGDVNGDGTPEIVVQSSLQQYVSVIDISQFDVRWTYFIDPVPPAGLKHHSTPVVSDMDKDGEGDVWALSANGTIYGLRGKTGYPAGELLWRYALPEGNRIISSPALYDFNKDGLFDAVFGGEGGSVYVVDGFAGKRDVGRILSTVRASNAPITSSVAIGDVDKNGMLDIVFSDIGDAVQVLRTNAKTFESKIIWPMFLGSAYHSAEVLQKDNIIPFAVMAGAGGAALLLLIIIKVLMGRKESRKRPKVIYL